MSQSLQRGGFGAVSRTNKARMKDAMASRTMAIDYENVGRSNDKRHQDGCIVR